MEDLFLIFLTAMLGTELAQKIVNNNENASVPFYLLFSLCFTSLFIVFMSFNLILYFAQNVPMDLEHTLQIVLLCSFLLSFGVYAIFKGKQQENKRKKK